MHGKATSQPTIRNEGRAFFADAHCLNGTLKQEHTHPPDLVNVEKTKVLNRLSRAAHAEVANGATEATEATEAAASLEQSDLEALYSRGPAAAVDAVLAETAAEVRARLPGRRSLIRRYQRMRKRALLELCGPVEGGGADKEQEERSQ